jgi:hypothetical protein
MATTTNYSWSTPDNTAYVKDGASAIRTLGSSVDSTLFTALGGTYPGLRLVKKQVVGTGVSSVAVTSAFSTTYDNYKIVYTGGVGSATQTINMILGSTTTGYWENRMYTTFSSATPTATINTNAAAWNYAGITAANGAQLNMDLMQPFLAARTHYFGNYIAMIGASGERANTGGYLDNTTSYTGFTLTPASGTLTGGTIYVYGYGAS